MQEGSVLKKGLLKPQDVPEAKIIGNVERTIYEVVPTARDGAA